MILIQMARVATLAHEIMLSNSEKNKKEFSELFLAQSSTPHAPHHNPDLDALHLATNLGQFPLSR
jgi:hypothetical protein